MNPPRIDSSLSGEGMKPRILDLFCGAGGASMGYYRAGFDVVIMALSAAGSL